MSKPCSRLEREVKHGGNPFLKNSCVRVDVSEP